MNITLCVITKNEENNIGKCIAGVKDIVNEIIVIDTGSTDTTVEIAKKLGAAVYFYEWDNNFSNARNYALSKATGDWIIFLDADEYFLANESGIIPELLHKIEKNERAIDAIFLKHISIDEIKESIIQTNSLIRIFKRLGSLYKGAIHESLYKVNGKLNIYNGVKHDLIIYHSGYSSDRIKDKAVRNLELLLKEVDIKKSNEMTNLYLSDCYLALGDGEAAIQYAEKFIDSNHFVYGFNARPYYNIIRSMNSLNYEYSERSEWIEKAVTKFPQHPDFQWYRGLLCLEMKQYEQALVTFLIAIELHSNYTDIEGKILTGILYEVYYFIGQLYEMKNDRLNAFEFYIKSLQENKYEGRAFKALIHNIKNYPTNDIINLLNEFYNKSHEDISFLVENLCEIRKGDILLYYSSIWRKRHMKSDNITFYTLYLNGKFDESFKMLTNSSQDETPNGVAQVYIVLTAILSCNDKYIIHARNIVDDSYKRILDVYIGHKLVLSDRDIPSFIGLFSEIVLVCNNVQIKELSGIKHYFKTNMSLLLGTILLNNQNYELALSEFLNYLQHLDKHQFPADASLFYNIGLCYFKLNLYQDAYEFFIYAFNNGYDLGGGIDYINWINVDSSVKIGFSQNSLGGD